MTHRIKILGFTIAIALATSANAADLSGTWKFDKALDYTSPQVTVKPMKFTSVQFLGNRAGLGQDCFGEFRKEKMGFSSVFRPLVDMGHSRKDLAAYLRKNFAFELDSSAEFYSITEPSACSDRFEWAIVSNDQLIVPYAGHLLYSFRRTASTNTKFEDASVGTVTTTPLPFNLNNYYELCSGKIMGKDGKAHDTTECAPLYAPVVARKENAGKLAQIIGNHNFARNNAEYTDDYAPPFAKNMHPTFIVFSPKNDFLLVRVDDFEPGPKSERNTFGGAYLSIRAGKVVDQLNSGCNIDEQYRCISEDGTKLFQLQENGKFQKLK